MGLLKKMLFGLTLISGLQPLSSQIKISELVQPNKLATETENKLYFVDFWATWCGPCVPAKKYLGSLQKQFKKDFYVISISQESPELVRNYLKKRPTDLAIGIDFDKETFLKHEINSLPTGILFNAEGKVLWKGHPGNFNQADIIKHIAKSKARLSIDEFVKVEAYTMEEPKEVDITPEDDFELMGSSRSSGYLDVTEGREHTSYEGSLKSILAYLLKVSDEQIALSPSVSNSYFKLNIKHKSRKHKNLVKHVLKKLDLKLDSDLVSGEVLNLTLENPKFWDTDQIDWGIGNPKYLIDDAQIQADNVSFDDIQYRLANLLEMPVITEGNFTNSSHDWQVHYKYYKLMQTDLYDNYGIIAEKKELEYPVYSIQKKTP